jgi:cysteine desulfurase/selenocysteine lyase
VPGLRLYGDADAARAGERLGVIPFALDCVDPRLVGAILSCDYGIAVRCGAFCAHPYVQRLLGADASCEGERPNGLVRASLGLASSADDVETFGDALEAIARGAHADDYVFDASEGAYWPRDWRPDIAAAFALDSGVAQAVGSPSNSGGFRFAGAARG